MDGIHAACILGKLQLYARSAQHRTLAQLLCSCVLALMCEHAPAQQPARQPPAAEFRETLEIKIATSGAASIVEDGAGLDRAQA